MCFFCFVYVCVCVCVCVYICVCERATRALSPSDCVEIMSREFDTKFSVEDSN